MTAFVVIMIVSFIIIALVTWLTIFQTNKAYEVLPSLSDVDPVPGEDGLNKISDESKNNSSK